MDSTPSPITPAYNYVDNVIPSYDSLLRQDLSGYLPSPSTITPFMEQQMMIAPSMGDQLPPFAPKSMLALASSQYPMVSSVPQPDLSQIPTPAPSSNSASTSISQRQTSPASTAANTGAPPKKNKYPCPYAQSHNCLATFTTSGHAARHGKKHTGEKGVHCPVCNKAFTRKDNMKQHERTHKGSVSGGSNSNSEDSTNKRSKAALTKDAQKAKAQNTNDSQPSRKSSIIQSPLSEVTSLAPTAIETPLNMDDSTFYPNSAAQMMMPGETVPDNMVQSSLYPPLSDTDILGANSTLPPIGKGLQQPLPPQLLRGFSDLDTLAQAAESFDPYYGTEYKTMNM